MRLNLTREHYIRAGATKVAAKDSTAVVYVYTLAGKPYAIGFRGKVVKPTFHHSFKTEADRSKFVARFFKQIAETEAYLTDAKAKRKAEAAKPHNFEVGLILTGSWGYEQTNVDFFEVVKIIGKNMVEIEQIGSQSATDAPEGYSSMSDHVVPNPESRTGKISRVKVVNGSVKSPIYGTAHVWNGKPKYASWYA